MPDPVSLASLFDAAEQAAMRGDFAAAARLLGEAARAQEAALGPDHLDLANTLNNLAVAHERSGQLDAAEREYRRAHAIAARTRPAHDPLVTTSAQNLREFCAANGRPVDVPPSALTLADDTSDLLGADPVTLPPSPGRRRTPIRQRCRSRRWRSPTPNRRPSSHDPIRRGPTPRRGPRRRRRNRPRHGHPSWRLQLPRPRPRRNPRHLTRGDAACRFRSSSHSAPSPRSSSGCWLGAAPRQRLGRRQQPRPTRRQPPQRTRPLCRPQPPRPRLPPRYRPPRRRPPHRRGA